MDGLELGGIGPQRDRLVPVVRSFLQPGQEFLAGPAPGGCPGEEQELFGVGEGEQSPDGVQVRDPGHFVDALAAGGPGAGEDQLADQLRLVLGDHLGDHAAHREAEEVDLVQAQRADEGDGVGGHRRDGVRRRAGRSADAPVIEGDDPVLRGDAVDDPGVPVVQDRGQVGEEDHRDPGSRTELAVGDTHPAGGDGAGRCVLVRPHHVVVGFLLVSHGRAFLWMGFL